LSDFEFEGNDKKIVSATLKAKAVGAEPKAIKKLVLEAEDYITGQKGRLFCSLE